MTAQLPIAIIGLTLIFSANGLTYADTSQQQVDVSVVDVIETDDCIVKRIAINVPAATRIQLVNDTDQAVINSSPAGAERPTVHLNVLADLVRGPKGEKTANLKLILNLSGGTTTRMTAVDSAYQLEKLARFSIKPGRYSLGQRIPILQQTEERNYFIVVSPRQR